jgi:hypothetical protein
MSAAEPTLAEAVPMVTALGIRLLRRSGIRGLAIKGPAFVALGVREDRRGPRPGESGARAWAQAHGVRYRGTAHVVGLRILGLVRPPRRGAAGASTLTSSDKGRNGTR